MIKKMLVEKLNKQHENAIVVLHGYAGETVTGIKKKNDLWIITNQEDSVGIPLTVKHLIQELDVVKDDERLYLGLQHPEELLFVACAQQNEHLVWFETESDNDMGEELSAMYESFIDENVDELIAYSDMLDQGLSVKMVRKYLGDEQADHMKDFCLEHGLLNEDKVDEVPTKVFKVRLEHAIELFVRGNSEEEVQDWLNCNTPESVKALLKENDKYVDENFSETILCECMSNSVEDITI